MTGKYRLTTLGCKVNQYESQQVRELLESHGLIPAAPGQRADLAVVNTCAVTCSAAAKSRRALRRLAADGATPVVALGCYASADPDAVAKVKGVTHVLGHETDIVEGVRKLLAGCSTRAPASRPPASTPAQTVGVQMGLRLRRAALVAPPGPEPTPHPDGDTTSYSMSPTLPIVNPNRVFSAPIREFAGRTRAFLKVQDGCDAYCTYCIIPKLRPRLGDKPIDVAAAEARRLVAAGHREIVLTGIYLGAYGRPTALRRRFAPGPSPLAALVDRLARTEGLLRLRLSSLEPGDVDDALLDVLAAHDNCVPHLHLPLQSGCADILRRMNRQYTVEDFLAMIERVRAALDRPAITTDIIVGFPGETDARFAETLAVARASRFCKIHAFPFSPRPGTAAAKWADDFVPGGAVRDRVQALQALERDLGREYRVQFIGRTERVLVEGPSPSADPQSNTAVAAPPLTCGRSDRYFEVHFEAAGARPGDLVPVRIDRVTPQRVHGTRIRGLGGAGER